MTTQTRDEDFRSLVESTEGMSISAGARACHLLAADSEGKLLIDLTRIDREERPAVVAAIHDILQAAIRKTMIPTAPIAG